MSLPEADWGGKKEKFVDNSEGEGVLDRIGYANTTKSSWGTCSLHTSKKKAKSAKNRRDHKGRGGDENSQIRNLDDEATQHFHF